MKTLLKKTCCYWDQIFSISFPTHEKLLHAVTQSQEPACKRRELGKCSELHPVSDCHCLCFHMNQLLLDMPSLNFGNSD